MNKGTVKKLTLASLALTAGLFLAAPAFADDHHGHGGHDHGHGGHDHISLSFGFGYNPYYDGYYGYPHYYHRPVYYGYPAYYAPPPTVVYEAPPQVVYAPAPVQVLSPAVVRANQTSPTFTDENGQTCREYQTTSNVGGVRQQVYGTACLQGDGTWRIVE